MKKGDERDERTFPESEHSDDERIHIDLSVCSLSPSPLSSMSLSLSLSVDMLSEEVSLQRAFRHRDGKAVIPAVLFANVHSLI